MDWLYRWWRDASVAEESRRPLKSKSSVTAEPHVGAPSPSGPADEDETPSSEDGVQGSLLLSWEFIAYWLVVAYAAFTLTGAALDVSRRLDDRTPGVIGLHSLLGLRKYMKTTVDVSNIEWRHLRAVAIPLTLLLGLFTWLSRLIRLYAPKLQLAFYIGSGLLFTGYLHEAEVVPVLGALLLNYLMADAVAGQWYGAHAIWGLNCTNLLLSQHCRRLSFAQGSSLVQMMGPYRGHLPWEVSFPLLTLRMLSYSLDLHQLRSGKGSMATPDIPISSSTGNLKARLLQPLPRMCYTFGNYVAYSLYPPLYVAGPLLTFKSFASQLRSPKATANAQIWRYAGASICAAAVFELSCHLFYMHALAASGAFAGMQTLKGFVVQGRALAAMMFFSLLHLFLKNLAIWRVSRLWALLDGIGAPENVRFSFGLVTSQKVFWRSWNASLSRWLARYVYLPLGGTENYFFALAGTFIFSAGLVGLRPVHLFWALAALLGLQTEQAVQRLLPWADTMDGGCTPWQRHSLALWTTLNASFVSFLMLCGFVLEGRSELLVSALVESPVTILTACLATYAAAQIVLELRRCQQGAS